ncbi:MAG: hypothetical protein HZC12_10250 [Nitrospirae bacterium]|nr:hypothetical protein [Nitrospirota bacterium]
MQRAEAKLQAGYPVAAFINVLGASALDVFVPQTYGDVPFLFLGGVGKVGVKGITKATNVFKHIKTKGVPPQGYKGGRIFQNREGKLPQGGKYREYDIDPYVSGQSRTAERIVIDESTGRAWYTPDHYKTFVEITP